MKIEKKHEPKIQEWLNCQVAEVDDNGDVWIENPQQGHWLDDENKG